MTPWKQPEDSHIARTKSSHLRSRYRSKKRQRRAFSLESLELRQLLSASPGIDSSCLGRACRVDGAFVPDGPQSVETAPVALADHSVELAPISSSGPVAAMVAATFNAVDPPGSLIGQFVNSGNIVAQTDEITLSLEAGQTVTVVIEPSINLRPVVELEQTTPQVSLASFAATTNGETIILQSVPIANAGDHSVLISSAALTTGSYTATVYLNAAVEEEELIGPSNNIQADAQVISNSSFIGLGTSVTSTRAAVVAQRGVDLEENFESGVLNNEWATSSSDAAGRIRVADFVAAAEGRYSLIMDRSIAGSLNRNEAIWTVDLSTASTAVLNFSHADFGDEENPMPAPNVSFGSFNGDGVSISDDGINWYTVLDATDIAPGVWQAESIDLVAAASAAGISLNSQFGIRFQQYDDSSFPADGRGYDDIFITTTPALSVEDWYEFSLTDGQTASVVLQSLTNSSGSLELYNSTGTLLASSTGLTNADQVIHNFVDATTNTVADDYAIRVLDPADQYSLVVTRDSTHDRESNSIQSVAQDLGGSSEAYGYVSDETGASLNLLQSFSGPEFTGFVPPDPVLAVGPSQIVAMVNTTISIYDKTTGQELFTQNLNFDDGFFGTVGATSTVFDPWVVYDDDTDRFFIVAIDVATDTESNVFLAVSTSSTPTSGTDWHKYKLDFTHDPEPAGLGIGPHFPDYEKLGVNDDAIFISGNYFPINQGTGIYAGITAIEKDPLLSGGPANIVFEDFFDGFSVFPMNQFSSGSTEYFAETLGADQIRIHAITDPLTTPARHTFDLTVPAYDPPVDVPQLGGGQPADSLGDRIMTGVWRNGSAWFAHAAIDPAIGDGEDVVRWYEVATNSFPLANPTLVQSGNVDPGAGIYAWVPAIAVDGAGNMGIGFAMGGPNQYFGAGFTGRLASDPPGQTVTPVTQLVAGEAPYVLVSGSRNRWGDYSGLAIDPSDDATFWVMNEYADDNGLWDTRIGSFQVDPIPDSDYYSIPVNNGDMLTFETFTPYFGPIDIVNALNPDLELYAPDGTFLTSDADSGSTFQNALISHTATQTGNYGVRVLAGGSNGTYVLKVSGATGADPAPTVIDSTPDDTQVVQVFPTVVTVEFSEPILATSVTADDLQVEGVNALSVNVSGQKLEFTIDPNVNVGDGDYTMTMSAGSVDDYQGNTLAGPFTATFTLDSIGPQILDTRWNGASFPASATILPGALTFEADLSEDLMVLASARKGPRSPGVDDIKLLDNTSGDVIDEDGINYDATTDIFTANYNLIPQGDYTLTLASGKGAFEDKAGNALDGEPIGAGFDGAPTGDGTPGGDYTLDFLVDIDTASPNPFERIPPDGALGYKSSSNTGFIHDVLDQDSFEFFAHAGEQISAILTIDAAVTATIQFNGPVTIAPPASSANPGETVIIPLSNVPLDGLYQLQISADGITHYDLELVRNAVNEAHVGDTDTGNELAIDASLLDLGSGRFGITGTSQRMLAFNHYNDPSQFIDISGTGIPTNLTDDGGLTFVSSVSNELIPDDILTVHNNGGLIAGINANIFFQNLPLPAIDIGRVLFPYWDDLADTAGNVYLEQPLVGGVQTLIAQWERPHFNLRNNVPVNLVVFQVQVPESGPVLARFAYDDIEFGDPELDFGNSGTIGYQESETSGFEFSFGQVDNPNGAIFPPVNVANGDVVDLVKAPDVDVYTIDLSGMVGNQIDIVLSGAAGADFSGETLELLDDADQVVATGTASPLGVPAGNYDVGILGLTVPDIGTNVYKIRVSSLTVGEYGVVLTDSVAFESEPNDSTTDNLRNLTGVGAALGFLFGTAGADIFEFDVAQGEVVTVSVQSLLDDPVATPLNSLDPELLVLASDGTTVLASDTDSLDGRGAWLSFVAPNTETVTIHAISTAGGGEYLLNADKPTISIDDVSQAEGDSGTSTMTFTLTRSDNTQAVSVDVETTPVSATADVDYTSVPATTVSFAAGGLLSKTVTVDIIGDPVVEPDEQFTVDLSNAVNINIGKGQGTGTIENDDVPPQVQEVRLGSLNNWTDPSFLLDIDPAKQQGYLVPNGPDQFRTAPWINIDTIYVTFTKDVSATFDSSKVSIKGVNVPLYNSLISSVTFDVPSLTGIIQLSQPFDIDKVALAIDDTVMDMDGNALDGEWNDGLTIGNSGDGTPGGDFSFRFNVLPGDADLDGADPQGGVGFIDANVLINSLFTLVGDPGYVQGANFDGDDGIGFIDANVIVTRLFTQLPPGDPVGGFPARPAFRPTEPRAIESEIDALFAALDDEDDDLAAFVA